MKNKLFLFVLFCLLCMQGFATISGPSAVCKSSTIIINYC